MKYAVRESSKFRKDLKRLLKRGLDRQKLLEVVRLLASGQPLPPKYKVHALTGDLAGLRDCHIQNDWVLLYKIEDLVLVLTLVRTGTHSDLGL